MVERKSVIQSSFATPSSRLYQPDPAPGSRPRLNGANISRSRHVVRDRAHLERMLALLDAGAVRPPPIAISKLKDAAEAHQVSEARHLRGKLVLEIR